MNCIVILYDEENILENKKDFGGKSALEHSFLWAEKVTGDKNFVKIIKKSEIRNFAELLKQICLYCKEKNADYVIYSYADLPFLNLDLTKKMQESHQEYKSEYTFADGYPYGFAPEIIDSGCLSILAELSQNIQKTIGEKPVARDSFWELIKTDVNSFDVESILASEDFRLLRYSFDCTSSLDFLSCVNLYKNYCHKSELYLENPDELSRFAVNDPQILKTVPSFYNLQICDSVNVDSIYSPYVSEYHKKFNSSPFTSQNFMDFEKISSLISQIADFSQNAVVGLSAFGEALNHPEILKIIQKILSYPGLSVFIETDGLKVTEDFCAQLQKIVENAVQRTNGWEKVMIGVSLDSFSAQTYEKIHQKNYFNQAVNAVLLLSNVIKGSVYPLFTRMNENEAELESFYRYWSEKSNASGGQLIIQKYDDFCGLLPQCKPADLSPVERNVCWHLRRDLTILCDGSVPLCREFIFENIQGNVFTDGIQTVWNKLNDELENHIEKKYCPKCGKCDEYYTYNF